MTALPHRLQLHGVPTWRAADGVARPLERKHAALLAWLWLEGPTPRARLAGLLWPDAPEDRARANLRQRLLKLRREAGDLVRDQAGVLALAADVQVDAADPPHAPLLQSLAFDDCDALTRWLEGQHEATRERRKREWLAEVREAVSSSHGGRLDDALYAADQLLQTDRESEEAYRVLMEVYYLRGDHAAALSAWDRCRDMLRQLYGARPSQATEQLGHSILAAADAASAVQQPPVPAHGATPQLPAAVLRPPRLVGREAALQALTEGWQAGHLLAVVGEAGVGKSRLLGDWAAALGHGAAGAVVAAARPGDAVLPYASLSRLLLAALEQNLRALNTPDAQQAARILPRLALLRGEPAEPVRGEYERGQALLALGRLLARCSAAGARAFVLDDLQFADAASLAALRVLTDPAPDDGTPPLRWACAWRGDEASAELQALCASWAAGGRYTQVNLTPLSAAAAQALLASLGVPALDAGTWAPAIWRQVGGNPAFLLESVKLLLTTGTGTGEPGAPLPLPASIEAVIVRRIELLSPRARHLAQLAAIAGSGCGIALAAAALACAPIELSEPLRELELRQVFYGRQFVHDVIATVTARTVPATVAEFMHRFVAEHLTAHGGDAAHIGEHWRACGEWRRAGRSFMQAAEAAKTQALVNEQAALVDLALAAFEQDPAAHDELFSAVQARASTYEAQGHSALRHAMVQRLQALARTEPQRLVALNVQCGWLTNLGQPVDEAATEAGLRRAQALGLDVLAWELARVLAWQLAMSNRADAGLALMHEHGAWAAAQADAEYQVAHPLALSSIHAYGDRLTDALAEGHRALVLARAHNNWPQALPAMSNLGLMHYWRGEYAAARALLEEARERRERLYGGGGSGMKIDIHLGAVLYEVGEHAAAQAMLQNVVHALRREGDNEYLRTDILLAENHLAQMHLALGNAVAAAAVLASEVTGLADRFVGRRLALRLRWQRLFAVPDPACVAELQALAARVPSPFNRALMELELARQLAPAAAAAAARALHDSPVARQRPGLQLHAAALWADALRRLGRRAPARSVARRARALLTQAAPFDMALAEAEALLAAAER